MCEESKAVIRCLFEEIEELEEALVERSSVQPARGHTLGHPIPVMAECRVIRESIQPDLV
jgi:hypothetical protein